jgi:uncharacterized membrane protein
VFDRFRGIPLHPLFVHAPLMLVTLTLALGFVYVILPPLRRRVDWALFLLAASAPVAAQLAALSGTDLRRHLDPSTTNKVIAQHQQYGETTRNLSIALFGVVFLLIIADRLRVRRKRRRAAAAAAAGSDITAPRAKAGGGFWTIVSLLLALAFLGVGGVTGYYLFQVGDSGAHMTWDGRIK